jgi:hypothetical protein
METITLDAALALVRAVIRGSTNPDARFAAVTGRAVSAARAGVEANSVPRARPRDDTDTRAVGCVVDFGVDSSRLHEGLARLAALWT